MFVKEYLNIYLAILKKAGFRFKNVKKPRDLIFFLPITVLMNIFVSIQLNNFYNGLNVATCFFQQFFQKRESNLPLITVSFTYFKNWEKQNLSFFTKKMLLINCQSFYYFFQQNHSYLSDFQKQKLSYDLSILFYISFFNFYCQLSNSLKDKIVVADFISFFFRLIINCKYLSFFIGKLYKENPKKSNKILLGTVNLKLLTRLCYENLIKIEGSESTIRKNGKVCNFIAFPVFKLNHVNIHVNHLVNFKDSIKVIVRFYITPKNKTKKFQKTFLLFLNK